MAHLSVVCDDAEMREIEQMVTVDENAVSVFCRQLLVSV